jgi:SpoVK/Ycf46/Vps4 family AAA+-type ATPase
MAKVQPPLRRSRAAGAAPIVRKTTPPKRSVTAVHEVLSESGARPKSIAERSLRPLPRPHRKLGGRPRYIFAGKTTAAARKLAVEWAQQHGKRVYRLELGAIHGKYIGETEKNLRRVFARAERAGAVLLLDEADALFGRRTKVKDAHDRYANLEVNHLLQRIEAYEGIVILATNRRRNLDAAFMRRLRWREAPPLSS